ncbi:MAG: ABC transporter permease [Candidatus Aphodomonas sp.]|nr:ABC transporter permease [Candidatus Aphodomonas sp.]
MLRYIAKRILMMIPVLLAVSFLIFTLMYLAPGDPARIILGDDAPETAILEKREELGLNDPFLVQYGRYIYNIAFHLDFGMSYSTGEPVVKTLLERYPVTIELALCCMFMMIVMGLPIGIISAVKQYSFLDNVLVSTGLIAVSMPNFWLGLVLIMVFSLKLRLLPASGFYGWKYWILPAMTVGFSNAASLLRTTRSAMLECIRQDYVDTARAKGQSEFKTIMHHVLGNAWIPILTVIGMTFGRLLGGAIISEQIFSIPGLGKLMIDSINMRDYPMVRGGVLMLAFTFSIMNLLVDILYTFIDPRLKTEFAVKKRWAH